MSEGLQVCDHGFGPGACPEEGCLYRREVKNALLGLSGAMVAADDQAQAMTDAELGRLLVMGRWTTIEVHEAGRRLATRATSLGSERLEAIAARLGRAEAALEHTEVFKAAGLVRDATVLLDALRLERRETRRLQDCLSRAESGSLGRSQ